MTSDQERAQEAVAQMGRVILGKGKEIRGLEMGLSVDWA